MLRAILRPSSLLAISSGICLSQAALANDQLAPRQAASAPVMAPAAPLPAASATANAAADPSAPAAAARRDRDNLTKLGSGQLFKPPRTDSSKAEGKTLTLSFENGDVREIVKNVIGDLLGESYVIDPAVNGTVTLRTARPITESQILPLLESVLRANGFLLVREGGYWRVTLVQNVRGLVRPTTVGGRAAGGTETVIYPVQNVGVKELHRLLEPFVRDPQLALRIDELRNLLFITASKPETDRVLEVVNMFDTDLLEGMSFALLPLQSGDVKTIMADYEKIVGAPINPFSGLLRVVPIERMNAVLLISPQAKIVQDARAWFERLDASGAETGTGQRLFVYNLQYTQAEKIQPVLQAALSGRSTATPAGVAPGQTAATLNAPVSPIPGQSIVRPGNTAGSTANTQTRPAGATTAVPAAGATAGAAAGQAVARNATIVADKDRNALLIVATVAEYNAIEAVIRRLDLPPKQVAIELQIAQIALNGDFQFGLQSYLQSGKFNSPSNNLSINEGAAQLASNGLFSYTWGKASAIKAILNARQSKGQTRTIAQPTMITLENQKATFNSGKQVSVKTQQTVGNGTVTSTDSFQYINTGININFTPRVSGRNILLEIQQEISDTQPSTTGSGNPDILRRAATTTVMVSSGDTMLMGGLFEETGGNGSAGLPLLSTIPVVGGLFGSQTWNESRSELVMLITPRILDNEDDTREAVDELRKRLKGIERLVPSAATAELPTRSEDRERLRRELRQLDLSLKAESVDRENKKYQVSAP